MHCCPGIAVDVLSVLLSLHVTVLAGDEVKVDGGAADDGDSILSANEDVLLGQLRYPHGFRSPVPFWNNNKNKTKTVRHSDLWPSEA